MAWSLQGGLSAEEAEMTARQAALGHLHALGVRPTRVAARCVGGVLTVDITLPAGAPQVQRVQLRLH